jgi:hypothetical protein
VFVGRQRRAVVALRRLRALVYRGNARYFRIDGAEAAERDYRAALAADEHNPVIRANLSRLLAEGRQ